MNQQAKVRELAKHVFYSLILDVWPRPAGVIDFGLRTDEHYGALHYAVRDDGMTMEQLDRALGNGPAIQALISERNPYRAVVFKTDYDAILDSIFHSAHAVKAKVRRTPDRWLDHLAEMLGDY